jgi:hypothetical protein
MQSNRVRVSLVREATIGTLPASARMRLARYTGESMQASPEFFVPEEIRSDRMQVDPTRVGLNNRGGLNFEFSYPNDQAWLSEILRSAFFANWSNLPNWDNSFVTGSIAGITGQQVTVLDQSGSGGFAGTSVTAASLLRFTGFGVAGNNGVYPSTGTFTSTTFSAVGLSTEASPPATARIKIVGIQATSGDVVATTTGLTTTTMNFVANGFQAGMWIKIGDAANAAFNFANAANNTWVRVAAINSINSITLDNLPAGWAADTGTSKTIRIFTGDILKNGLTRNSLAIERSFLGQTTPTHILHLGMVASRFSGSLLPRRAFTSSVEFMGLDTTQGTAANGTTYVAAPDEPVMNGSVSVARIAEANAVVASPNWARRLDFSIDNNLRMIESLGEDNYVDVQDGECAVSGTMETYFGSNAFYAKLLAGTVTNINSRLIVGSRAMHLQFPRVTFLDGSPNAAGKNQDVVLAMPWRASFDSVTNSHVVFQRTEYFN